MSICAIAHKESTNRLQWYNPVAMFIDQVEIFVHSGKGGDGVVHFRREKYVPRGGPDGGDGGKGGNVILEVVPTLNTLSNFRQKARFQAKDGEKGARQNMTGHSGADLVVRVPPGTLVYDRQSGELLGDLVEAGQRLVVASGGRGGRGNARFASSVRQAPRLAERGEPAQERELRLELKLIADIGIVGVPNAGKSTFLAAVTNAQPKIAAYPFTTLEPNLGVADLDGDTSLVLADIPGLIEGAHLGAGLGYEFLRHIQRTRVLIHLLDGQAEDPLLDFAQINTELALFDPELSEKPQVVALNKMDLPEVNERWTEIKSALQKRGYPVFAISALRRLDLLPVLQKAAQLLSQAPEATVTVELPVYRPESDPNEFAIQREADGWRISSKAIERAAAMTYWDEFQSIRRFQRVLEALGVDVALRKAGVQEGDTVYIGEYELEWYD